LHRQIDFPLRRLLRFLHEPVQQNHTVWLNAKDDASNAATRQATPDLPQFAASAGEPSAPV